MFGKVVMIGTVVKAVRIVFVVKGVIDVGVHKIGIGFFANGMQIRGEVIGAN